MSQSIDILIRNGIVVSLDPERRVIEDGAVAVAGSKIVAVGRTAELDAAYDAAQVIDASNMVVLPGLIDGHAHAGHGLVKSLGAGRSNVWFEACEKIYTVASSVEFWRAEAALSALDRLKSGVTTGVSLLGGGPDIMRTDEPIYGAGWTDAVGQVGIRGILAVGRDRRMRSPLGK